MRRLEAELIETDILQSPALPGFCFSVERSHDRAAIGVSYFYP
jgi:hypothetical protein